MKCRVVMAVFLTALSGIFLSANAQKNYYVVVGAFSTEGKAEEFTTHLPSMSADTAYSTQTADNVVQLYVFRTTSEEMALARSLELQRTIDPGNNVQVGNYETISITNRPGGKQITASQGYQNTSDVLADISSSKTNQVNVAMAMAPARFKSKMFKFTISNPEGETLPGNIHFVDFEREKDLATYAASDYTDLINPGNKEDMALVCGIFGYKFSEKYIDTTDPSMIEGAYQEDNGAWVIPYHLERLEKGDVSVMYNVAFHKDAAIMLPDSKTDLDELVFMMKENPNYEITIHGHCNGKGHRKILGLSNKHNYFDTKGCLHLFGSAKMLSELRAEAVKTYLMEHGIEAKRIKTFAWGATYTLVDPNSKYAKLNDRIEIEIRKD